jgi:hypothetical protein
MPVGVWVGFGIEVLAILFLRLRHPRFGRRSGC